MKADLWTLYEMMYKSRLFEEAVKDLWEKGEISGEMHMGIGEEAIIAGVAAHLVDGDSMALDHRGTSAMLMRGVNPMSLMREFLGRSDGLCAGRGGHMHLFSKEHLAASSGIVGASGPTAIGFALAGQQLRRGNLTIAYFGEGAVNQGMMLEALNLAVVWKLPVIFVCKDDNWSIMTNTPEVTGGDLVQRANSLGMPAEQIDGSNVESVWMAVKTAAARARSGYGPTFLHANCIHHEGHFLNDPYLRWGRQPFKELRKFTGPIIRALFAPKGQPFFQRVRALWATLRRIRQGVRARKYRGNDPIQRTRHSLVIDPARLQALETRIHREVDLIVQLSLADPLEVHG